MESIKIFKTYYEIPKDLKTDFVISSLPQYIQNKQGHYQTSFGNIYQK